MKPKHKPLNQYTNFMKTKLIIVLALVSAIAGTIGLATGLMSQNPNAIGRTITVNISTNQVQAVLNDLGWTNFPTPLGYQTKIMVRVERDGTAKAWVETR